jgi:hypothetical protein
MEPNDLTVRILQDIRGIRDELKEPREETRQQHDHERRIADLETR